MCDCTGSKIAVKCGIFLKSTVFCLPIEQFSTFTKIDSIFEFSGPLRVFFIRHTTILETTVLKTLLQEIPNFEVGILENYMTKKKNSNSFKIPWPTAIE